MSARLAMFKERHRGERCVIVANGPSLNKTDFSIIKREICFGLNKIFLGIRKFGFYPRYYVAVNPLVIEQSAKEIQQLNCVKFLCKTAAQGHIAEDALTVHVATRNPQITFSTDLTQGLNQGYTVTYAAMQIAYFLGFEKVVLVGLDHRYSYEGEPNATQVMQTQDPNHFDSGYFAKGQSWQNPDLAQSTLSYQHAKAAFEKAGRSIVDATIDGACTVFEKVSLDRALA
jgi:hypothetical protein